MGGLYTGSWNCGCGTALKEMAETKRQYGKEPDPSSADYEHDRIAYHVVISWSPGEAVLPEKAMEITRRFCEEYLPGYEAVYSAHLDTEHMHTHIIFNSVNYKTGRKYHFPADEWEKNIQPLIDRLCKAYGLRTLEEDTGKSIVEYTRERKEEKKNNSARKNRKHNGNYCYRKQQEDEYSISDYVRDDIDRLIESCGSFEEFVQKLQEQGYEIRYGESEKYGTYMKLRNVGMKRFRRTYTLGADYTVDMIKRRIEAYHEPLGNTTNIMASPVSGVGVATSTGIPEIDNALNIIKALFIGLISTIGVIILAKGISDTAIGYQQQDSHGMFDGIKGIAAGAIMAFIGIIIALLGF